MTNINDQLHRTLLQKIARQAMISKGLLPDFSPLEQSELNKISGAVSTTNNLVKDLRDLLWCSIDNDDSLDLDQLTCATSLPNGVIKIMVAIADVDSLVKKQSAIDNHAQHNTTSVYTTAFVFTMLPERLSNNLTSLNYDVDRLAIIIEMTVLADGALKGAAIYRALVRNKAKLAYNSVAVWLEGRGPVPPAISAVKGLEENLRLQDCAAQTLKSLRHTNGALNLETIEACPVFKGEELKGLEAGIKNSATDIIEEIMIATNGITARFLAAKKFPSLRRVVHTPKRWDRIMELTAEQNYILPKTPDPKALNQFLEAAKKADPLRFPDLSLNIIKLLGSGEYIVELPGGESDGHFGLAVKDYTHSTAPNRRYPDLITQRLLKAALAGEPIPYLSAELVALAKHCTEQEDSAREVERQVAKSAAAMLLESRIGEKFAAIVTGVNQQGTWVRIFSPAIEGKLVSGYEGLDVAGRLQVQLVHTDVLQGFIDFKRV